VVISLPPRLKDRLCSFNPDILWWGIILLGAILRLRQYLSNRSLWADEASLAYNVANRTFLGLTQPLDFQQGAPFGFLFIEKAFLVTLGNVDQVMRLFPLFAGIASLYLLYRIAKAHITGGLLAGLLFAASWYPIYYSSELKQYSSDIMTGLLLIFLATRCLRKSASSGDFFILGAAGALVIWISHPSAFVLAGIGLAMFAALLARQRHIPFAWLAGLGLLWITSFGIEYHVSLKHLISNDYLQDYWRKNFMPLPPWSDVGWLMKTYHSMLVMTLNTIEPVLVYAIPILVMIGGISLLFRDRILAIIILAPFVLAMIASALQRYPLKDRFMLFLVPLVLMLIAEGLGSLYRIVARWNTGIARAVYALPTLFLFFISVNGTFRLFLSPYNRSDIKPVGIRGRAQAGGRDPLRLS
jgi:hypothetical protein